jgi:glutamate-ammonia-ligase adenylyltransferase
MTANSDLDLIIVYDFDEDEPQSDGERSLYGGQYFARLTQRLVSALAAQTNYGALYTSTCGCARRALRPVATMLGSFESYQENEAWTWEHLALTRARVFRAAGVRRAGREGDQRRALPPRDAETIAGDVVEMRAAIAAEKRRQGALGPEICGRRLVDLEFIAQYLQLVHAPRSRRSSTPRPRACSTRRRGSACWRRRLPTCCARRCGSIRT